MRTRRRTGLLIVSSLICCDTGLRKVASRALGCDGAGSHALRAWQWGHAKLIAEVCSLKLEETTTSGDVSRCISDSPACQ